jgi:D-3-phosphoglycerate dehydrogenase
VPHVLVAGRIHEAGIDVLRAAPGVTFEVVEEVSTDAYAPRIPPADALLIRTQPLPASIVAGAPRLRIVSRHGVGYDSVDVQALNARGIPLAVIGDANSRIVAEHAFTLVLALAKRVPAHDRAVRKGDWGVRDGFPAAELWGKTLFLVGFGRIGRLVAGMAAAFGMRVLAHDPYRSADAIRAGGAEPVPALADGLRAADAVSLHMPKAEGNPLIGADELALMKPGVVLVNTARGGLIDEGALADALDAGRIAGAGLDVFEAEPPAADGRLFRSGRTVLSLHIAGLTEECAARMGEMAARNILDFFAGRLDPALVVNRDAIAFGPPGARPS